MNVFIAPQAQKQLHKLQKFDQLAVIKKLHLLGNEGISGQEKLSGFADAYRVRVGVYRIVYRKLKEEIVVIRIQHRKDVYRKLTDLLE
jgi:mRNA interferase RelE/StbE